MLLGVNLTSPTKVLKCAKDDDIKAGDEADRLNWVYEAKGELSFLVGSSFFHVLFATRHVHCLVPS